MVKALNGQNGEVTEDDIRGSLSIRCGPYGRRGNGSGTRLGVNVDFDQLVSGTGLPSEGAVKKQINEATGTISESCAVNFRHTSSGFWITMADLSRD
jgi:hypothetical protein